MATPVEHIYEHLDLHGNELRHASLNVATLNGDILEALDKYYVHSQGVPAATWTVNHNLGKYPSVTVVDSGDNVVWGEIDYVSPNTLVLNFGAAFGGKAFVN